MKFEDFYQRIIKTAGIEDGIDIKPNIRRVYADFNGEHLTEQEVDEIASSLVKCGIKNYSSIEQKIYEIRKEDIKDGLKSNATIHNRLGLTQEGHKELVDTFFDFSKRELGLEDALNKMSGGEWLIFIPFLIGFGVVAGLIDVYDNLNIKVKNLFGYRTRRS